MPESKNEERMMEILERKKLLLGDMLALTEAQSSVIKQETLDELQRLVEEKQRKIDEIDRLDDEFGILFDGLKKATGINKLDEIDVSAFPGLRRLKEMTAGILDLVHRISEVEKANSASCRQLLEQIGLRIKRINQGKKINSAYNPSVSNTFSHFVDRKK